MTLQGLEVLWSYWRRNPWQLFTLLIGIALSTALWSGVQAINAEARASYAAASNTLYAHDLARVTRADGSRMTVDDYVTLRRIGWPVSPLLEGQLESAGASFQIIGIDPFTFPMEISVPGTAGGGLAVSPQSAPAAIAHSDDLGALGRLNLSLQADDSMAPGTVLVDIATADNLLDAQGSISYLLLLSQPLLRTNDLPPIYQVTREDTQADVVRLTESFHLNLTAFGLLSFAVGVFIVYGAVGLAFEQRRSVFRTLRALGIPLKTIMLSLSLELAVFAAVAGLLGVALGYVIAAALLPDVAATLRGLYGAEVSGQLQLRASWWLSGLAMALGGTAVAAAAALYKLAHMPVLAINHPRAMRLGATEAARRLAAVALGVMALGLTVALLSDGLLAGFALLAALMIGAAFFLPMCLDRILEVSERQSSGALSQWFWADSRQQLPGLSMALMALMLAMAANIGVSTMVSSFRLTFVDYLDQRLSSELYIALQDVEDAAALRAFLTGKVDALLPILSADTPIGGQPAETFGITDHATYRENWPLLNAAPDVWERLAAGEGVLVNEQLSRRQNINTGDTLTTGDVVLGVYGDYGNPIGQVIMGLNEFSARFPDVETLRFGIRTGEADEISAVLRDEFQLSNDALINQEDLKAFSIQVFERTFAVTGALNVLTLSVAGLAIFISLLTLATMRLPQLAPVWALGLTRRDLSKLELVRALCLASLTALLSVPVGLLLAWVLLAIVNVEAFGWRLPMYLFPMAYVRLAGLAVLAAVLAALWPAVRLARTDTQSLLRVFSNEK